MGRSISITLLLALLIMSVFAIGIRVHPVRASETIYIRADGSIDPPTTPIETFDNVTYTFTDNVHDSIVVERDNIMIDGASFAVQGDETGLGLTLQHVINVTIKNVEVKTFRRGIYLNSSSYNTVSGNNITANSKGDGVYLFSSGNNTICGNTITNNGDGVHLESSSYNTISDNIITSNRWDGIFLYPFSTYNTISGNNITNNASGIQIVSSNYNTISGNNITNNGHGIAFGAAYDNSFYHNHINNTIQVHILQSANMWDNGCEGNYWSDYNGTDLDSDGIGDTPYIIDGGNQDNYPLMNPYWNPGDINHDLKIDIFDAVLVCDAYGSTPSDLNWNCHCDIVEPYGIVDILDVVLMADSYGEEYIP